MGVEITEPNCCVRGCCRSDSIPLHLPSSSYTLLSPIARGGESVVYEATLGGKRVAVKKPVLSTSQDLDKFHKELQLLCELDHPGISKLVAAHAKPPNYMFFFEFYESPNLAEKLHGEEWSPDVDQVLMISIHLAKAMQYLHNLGILHRDVKPANVLLDRDLIPHLADFGLAEHKKDLSKVSAENWRSSGKPTGGFHKKNMVGTLVYMAPEILKKEVHTEKSDVYSFGISINELITGVVPYTDLRAEAQAHTVLEMNYTEQQLTAAVVSDNLRPIVAGLESGVPSDLLHLIQRCWDSNPENRPSFEEIVLVLSSILDHREKTNGPLVRRGHPLPLDDYPLDVAKNFLVFQEAVNWSNLGNRLSKKVASEADSGSAIWHDSLDETSVYCPVLSWGSFATCGKRETMEDTHFLMPHLSNERDIHVFGIFDGHRGAEAAEFSAQALPGFLQAGCISISPAEALKRAFVETDKAFRSELDSCRISKRGVQKDWHPGCCAVASLIVRNKLFVANAGDCRIVLCRAGCPIVLTKDHVASCPEERERVVSAGGQVKWQLDTWRVGHAALQVTRSIGDDDLKPAVTAEPEITETILSTEDEFLVMASDGLWDVVSNTEVISIIRDTVKEPGMCSKRLATEAAERGSKDNITEHFVDDLLALQEKYDLSEDTIIGLLWHMITAGMDTTAIAVEWAMAELIRNPRVKEKAQEELINVWAVARDPEVWKNPLEFRPDRFLEEDVDMKGHDFRLLPFGAGRRVCPGAQLGINLVTSMLGHLLHHFSWAPPAKMTVEDIDLTESPGMVTYMKTPLKAVATPRLSPHLNKRTAAVM